MKTNVLSVSALVIGVTMISGVAMASPQNSEGHNPAQELAQLPFESISVLEKTGLLLMREEEKLARDVYLTLYDKWGVRIFSNIAKSEQKHTDAVKALLDKYYIADPVTDDTVGVFLDQRLQDLYDDLVAKGSVSQVEAFKVGATIEDLDIFDLKEALSQTDNQDITKVYESLERGSRNHLRAFNKQLEKNNASYTAQFLSQNEYDSIANSDKEKGSHGDQKGGGKNGNSGDCDHSDDGEKKYGQKKGHGKGNGQGRGWGRNFQEMETHEYDHSLEEVRPRAQQYGRNRNMENRGGGRRGWGRNNKSEASVNQEASLQNSRSFYHFFAKYFR